jgi:hypothetical protein
MPFESRLPRRMLSCWIVDAARAPAPGAAGGADHDVAYGRSSNLLTSEDSG